MSEAYVIWHNPRCSKSRATLRILEEAGVPVEIRLYLENPPGVGEIEEVMGRLGIDDPRAMMRTKESEYRELDLKNPARTRAELLQAMADHPRLIERPIVLHAGRAVIGRPPERVRELLAD